MSLRALPLIALPLIIYNILLVFAGDGSSAFFAQKLFSVNMIKGAEWVFTRGDVIILLTFLALFIELIKSTWTGTASLVDHGLSMVVFIVALIEFLVVNAAATSVFFFIVLGAVIDVVAGFTIGIRVARRDLSIGADT
jgi:hypothetical protein